MPTYVLTCEECDLPLDEVVLPIKEREKLKCSDCGGPLHNDYSRQRTSSFQLKGSGWPGKTHSIENSLMKERG